ncbi:MAG TPA: hypothetical protein VFQ35_10985 [Polyangiaceae bacterium]|nr:hypothetical protein [Polyangiaceae bacterium]
MNWLHSTEAWTSRLLGAALVLQTLELVQIRAALRDDGVFAWPVLRREHARLPALVRALFAPFLPYSRFVVLAWFRLGLALVLLAGESRAAPFLLFTQVAVCVRFRGTFNGGSDYMTVLVLLGLTLPALFGSSPLVATAGYCYVAVQLVFSYFIAGLVKWREPSWRSGTALARFTNDPRFRSPRWARALFEKPRVGTLACWAVIAFECTFPVALVDGRATLAYAIFGATFHLFNVVVFGLNRFFFAWSAAYPALFLASHLRG